MKWNKKSKASLSLIVFPRCFFCFWPNSLIFRWSSQIILLKKAMEWMKWNKCKKLSISQSIGCSLLSHSSSTLKLSKLNHILVRRVKKCDQYSHPPPNLFWLITRIAHWVKSATLFHLNFTEMKINWDDARRVHFNSQILNKKKPKKTDLWCTRQHHAAGKFPGREPSMADASGRAGIISSRRADQRLTFGKSLLTSPSLYFAPADTRN